MNNYSVAEYINAQVNFNTQYRTDLMQYGVPEFWDRAKQYGDCEDYALAKRHALLLEGWSKDALGLCVCYMENGDGHCVLWVATDKGSFILDNNYESPMKPSELPYRWESMLCNGVWQELRGFA
jgi:predicted transglutaminase-like cysteine proteinase